MKFAFQLLVAVIGMTLGSQSFATGTNSGGGGKGVVCRQPGTNAVLTVETLDLWEARELHQLAVTKLTGDLAGDVDAALVRLKSSAQWTFSSTAGPEGEVLCRNEECVIKFLRQYAQPFLDEKSKDILRLRGIKLESTNDALELVQPEQCAIEQIVNYQPSGGKVLINQDLFTKLDHANQVALIVHEAYYKFLRDYFAEQNSLRVRRAVGFVLSGKDLVSPAKMPFAKGQMVCETPTAKPASGLFTGYDFPTNILTFDLKASRVDFRVMGGSALLGITGVENSVQNPLYLKRLFRDKDCPGFQSSMNYSGPVEFDRELKLTRGCDKGERVFFLLLRNPGDNQSKVSRLKCRELKKEIPF